MALTDAQKLDARRFAGYPALGDAAINDLSDFAYGYTSPGQVRTLFHRLTTLRPEEEAVLTTFYLPNLTALEAAIPASGANLDTDQASVWVHNKSEISDRAKLFRQQRLDMCGFLGISPGPSIGGGGFSVTRG